MTDKNQIPADEQWIYESHNGKEPVVESLKRAIAEAEQGLTVSIDIETEIDALLDKGKNRTKADKERLRVLTDAQVAYEEKAFPQEYCSPAQMLEYLMECNSLNVKKVSKQSGVSKKRISAILNAGGAFTVDESAKLGKRFCLKPTAFLDKPTQTTEES